MEYEEFYEDFAQRTLKIIDEYKGPWDATLLINCMLGLLVLPKEKFFKNIPKTPIKSFGEWGGDLTTIKNECDHGYEHPLNLQQLVRRMRNAIAHFDIEPTYENRTVKGFSFKDGNKFHAEFTIEELKKLISELSKDSVGGA